MDLLLIFLSIAGFVFGGVMLLLGFRTRRMEQESDARVQELQAIATGSVLFGSDSLQSHDHKDDWELAWDGMLDETVDKVEAVEEVPALDWTPEVHAPANQFVLNVPTTAGTGQVFSFARTQRRSRT